MNDQEILDRIKKGDEAALDYLYKKNYKIYALHEGAFSVKEKPSSTKDALVLSDTLTAKPVLKKLSNGYGRVGSFSFPVHDYFSIASHTIQV